MAQKRLVMEREDVRNVSQLKIFVRPRPIREGVAFYRGLVKLMRLHK